MKTKLLIVALLLALLPYSFLATSLIDVPKYSRAFNCTLIQDIDSSNAFGLSAVYFSPIGIYDNGNFKVFPQLLQHNRVLVARCGDVSFQIGVRITDHWLKVGDKMSGYTQKREAYWFGVKVMEEEGFTTFGKGWFEKQTQTEGQKIAMRLVNDKEVQTFDNKEIK